MDAQVAGGFTLGGPASAGPVDTARRDPTTTCGACPSGLGDAEADRATRDRAPRRPRRPALPPIRSGDERAPAHLRLESGRRALGAPWLPHPVRRRDAAGRAPVAVGAVARDRRQ